MSIDKNTSLEELAVQVSTALADAGIVATLSGGAAVSIYSDNAYESADLDFVTSEGHKLLSSVIGELGFRRFQGSRLFEHPESEWLVEFPPGPLGFGDTIVDAEICLCWVRSTANYESLLRRFQFWIGLRRIGITEINKLGIKHWKWRSARKSIGTMYAHGLEVSDRAKMRLIS